MRSGACLGHVWLVWVTSGSRLGRRLGLDPRVDRPFTFTGYGYTHSLTLHGPLRVPYITVVSTTHGRSGVRQEHDCFCASRGWGHLDHAPYSLGVLDDGMNDVDHVDEEGEAEYSVTHHGDTGLALASYERFACDFFGVERYGAPKSGQRASKRDKSGRKLSKLANRARRILVQGRFSMRGPPCTPPFDAFRSVRLCLFSPPARIHPCLAAQRLGVRGDPRAARVWACKRTQP